MVLQNIYIRIAFVILLFLLIFYLLYTLRTIVNPILIAFIISYILHPLVKYIEKIFKSRTLGVVVIYILFLLSLFLTIVFVIPPMISDFYKFTSAFFIGDIYEGMNEGKPYEEGKTKLLIDNNNNGKYDEPILINLIEKVSTFLENKLSKFPALKTSLQTKLEAQKIKEYFYEHYKTKIGSETELIKKIFNFLFIYLILVPIYVIFISLYLEKIIEFFLSYMPPKYQENISGFLKKVNAIISAFLRGKFWIAIIKSLLTLTGLLIFKSAYPLAFTGLQFIATFIPNLFIIVGIIPNFVINTLQANSNLTIWGCLGTLVVIEIIESIIGPYILGKNVGVHPVIAFIAILAGAKLFGILGFIIAIPVVSLIKVVWCEYIGPALKFALSRPPFNE